ncbi:hypothetical protein [Bythopirellula goksoeyrii]|uniref:PEP-CTERM protein-sorting domain-containing protein n=1 Tax=Bythopirellula goksoeyrii TaxID=1400387 RepID=A0A5B9QE70_9BACT|nr:hypothetical protein [Bythopirellula goksoeyrii]QEG35206.1 hypothetical protein Pr1d_25000 [Bythopirellula goksoeyrii]
MRCFGNCFARLGVALACVMLLGANAAIAQHSDLELFSDGGQVGAEPRIAEGEFGESPNQAYRANEPGVESDPDELVLEGETPLPGGALVGFDLQLFTMDSVSKSLFYWNGVGSVDFTSLPSPYELKISDATESFSVQIDGTTAAAGFDFDITADGTGVDPAGFLHHDLIFDLVDAGGAGILNPASGVYAFATTFKVAGLTDSEPVFWVQAAGVDESVHEAAVEYVALSQGIIPEPTSLALLGGMMLAGVCLRGRS